MITPEQLARVGTEAAHQCALMCWAASSGIVELKLLFAIPNGEQRSAVTGARLKAQGVKRGIPDLFLPVMRNGKGGLWIELKKVGGIVSENQWQWLEQLEFGGYATRVCFGWIEAKDCLLEYLQVPMIQVTNPQYGEYIKGEWLNCKSNPNEWK